MPKPVIFFLGLHKNQLGSTSRIIIICCDSEEEDFLE